MLHSQMRHRPWWKMMVERMRIVVKPDAAMLFMTVQSRVTGSVHVYTAHYRQIQILIIPDGKLYTTLRCTALAKPRIKI